MTILQGGDDLLFLAPMQNRDGKTLFLCVVKSARYTREEFKEINEIAGRDENYSFRRYYCYIIGNFLCMRH